MFVALVAVSTERSWHKSRVTVVNSGTVKSAMLGRDAYKDFTMTFNIKLFEW